MAENKDLLKETNEITRASESETPDTKSNKTKAGKVKEPSLSPEDYMKEKISYQAFKDDGKYKDDLKVIANGHNFIIKRGVIVEIPRYVVSILESKDRELRSANIYLEEAIRAGQGL